MKELDLTHRTLPLLLAVLCIGIAVFAGPIVVGQTYSIHSAILNEDRSYQVALPDGYGWAKDRSYPVLYVLDGETEFLHTAVSAGYLAANGEIPEMIVVGIVSAKRIRDFTQTDWASHWVGGGGAPNFKRFLAAELMPEIERTHRTNGFRVLSGHSAGGQFVLYCLAAEPSLFQAYFALSPSLDWDDHLPQRSLEKSFASTPKLNAFLYFAWSDDSGGALADDEVLAKTLRTKAPQGFRWHTQAFPDETHTGMPLLAEIDALRHLYAGYLLHDDQLDKGFAYAQKHFQDVSKTVGYSLPVPESVINDFGYAALSAGKTQEAIEFFKQNVQANPNSANAFDGLADGYGKAGEWKEAAAAADKAVALATEFKSPNLPYYADHARKIGDQLRQGAKESK